MLNFFKKKEIKVSFLGWNISSRLVKENPTWVSYNAELLIDIQKSLTNKSFFHHEIQLISSTVGFPIDDLGLFHCHLMPNSVGSARLVKGRTNKTGFFHLESGEETSELELEATLNYLQTLSFILGNDEVSNLFQLKSWTAISKSLMREKGIPINLAFDFYDLTFCTYKINGNLLGVCEFKID